MRVKAGVDCVGVGCNVYSFRSHLRADELLFGVLLAYLRHFRPEAFKKLARSRIALTASVCAIMTICALPFGAPAFHALAITLAYLGLGYLLPLTIDLSWPTIINPLIRLLAGIGGYSYSIYLWHGIAVGWVPHSALASFLLYLAVAIGLGALASRLIETRALRFRDRMFPSRERCAANSNALIASSPP